MNVSETNDGNSAMTSQSAPVPREPARLGKLAIVLAGIVAGQAFLYGPSLAGRKILLPLDLLALPSVYLSPAQEGQRVEARNFRLSDLVQVNEPARRFAASELAAGRLPMWTPWIFAGVPFTWPNFSPFLALAAATASPLVLAWTQLLGAVVAGLGACLFCRRVLRVSFWPSTVAAWAYPLTGFFVFWQGYSIVWPVVWLPWIFLGVDGTMRRSGVLAPLGLAAATWLVCVSGQLDLAGQVLLTSAAYALWCSVDVLRAASPPRRCWRGLLRVAACWVLGLMLAAPTILPVVEYSRAGVRLAKRVRGADEKPPTGLAALPQIVLPDMYGRDECGVSIRLNHGAQMESSAAAHTGVLATLLLAPLALGSRRHRSMNVFWAALILLSLGWCLNVPGLVSLLRLPGLNLLSHNRWVFAASFGILALAVVGLEQIRQGSVRWRWWLAVAATALAGLCAWCVYRAVLLPEPFASQLGRSVGQGNPLLWVASQDAVRRVQSWCAGYYAQAAVVSAIGTAGWILLWLRRAWPVPLHFWFGALLVAELLWFASGRAVQCDPKLYYPPIPVLERVARAAPGRAIGCNCLPANLLMMAGLRDIRGYDAIDPARLIDLLEIARNPESEVVGYSQTQFMVPKATYNARGEVQLSPVLDMLGVRYAIFPGPHPPQIDVPFEGDGYWVCVNPRALPRAWVPSCVEMVTNSEARLEKLAQPEFDPRAVAYVETPLALPDACRGSAEIVEEIPTRIVVSLRMETPGLLVLADTWDKGWQAYLNGQRVPILRTNHAIRGVVIPAGSAIVEFRYQPASFAWGVRLAGLAAVVLLVGLGVMASKGRLRASNGSVG